MKKWQVLACLAALSVTVAGCGDDKSASTQQQESKQTTTQNQPKQEEAGKDAFVKYLDSIRPILQENVELGAKFQEARTQSSNRQLSNADFAKLLSDTLIPEGNKMQEELAAIHPEAEFHDVHEKLNKMVGSSVQAFTELVAAVDTGDTSKVTSANQLMAEARELDQQLLGDLQSLAKKYGVELNKQ
ncbi:hypothetical protein [Aneurinibacillus uraniidurans]|uniref:hypothetical protein n=1 Tax=Aneurinibacillus uraniidurans TaxID=2966586 RepID=UPI0023490309|nr:hypothetical protein [Aneurinibacillus sp. B1]WCN36386.1 hypothetical protein PO771_10845 [Aneurinibacillus sp. B1]